MKNAKILVCATLAISTVACGNLSSNTMNAPNSNNTTQNSVVASTFSAAEQCSATPNIEPSTHDGSISDEFFACSNAGTVQIFPADQITKTVCVIPVIVSGNQVSIVSAPQCGSSNAISGIAFSFANAAINGALVVDQYHSAALSTCFSSANLQACATQKGIRYSYGQF